MSKAEADLNKLPKPHQLLFNMQYGTYISFSGMSTSFYQLVRLPGESTCLVQKLLVKH